MAETQTYQNHVRYFPLFHFVLVPILTLNFLYQSVRLYQEPSLDRTIWVVISFVFVLMILAARAQALKVQDRVIRLEENLRYKAILSPDLAHKAADLRLSQIIALRFASDAELPSLVERTLNGEFNKPKEIKLAIKDWRGDYHRV
jgi:hypothetical protein